ncbi:MAG TPA: hypothetical protein VMW51_06710 [Terriglobia bacterium]|nr:hypothetical protein [Terriglobia bacterium]
MKTILSLVFLGAVIFCAIRIVPVYVQNYELQDYLNHMAVEASVQQPQQKPEALQNEIYTKAESLGLPVERQDIKVSVGRTVLINVEYSVYVDLRLYMLPLHFTPSAKNSNI